jgi:hypothetical protein
MEFTAGPYRLVCTEIGTPLTKNPSLSLRVETRIVGSRCLSFLTKTTLEEDYCEYAPWKWTAVCMHTRMHAHISPLPGSAGRPGQYNAQRGGVSQWALL